MNSQSLSFLCIFLSFIFCDQLIAQYASKNSMATEEFVVHSNPNDQDPAYESVDSKEPIFNTHCKKLSSYYSGFAIEIAFSKLPIDKKNPLFKEFGNIYISKQSDGGYSYLIKGEFSSNESAMKFYQDIIVPKVPKAVLLEFKEGNRKVVNR